MWAWGGGICDIPPKLNLPLPVELKYGYRQQQPEPGQMLFYVSRQSCAELAARLLGGGVCGSGCCWPPPSLAACLPAWQGIAARLLDC